jgi:ectoine hydroxylase-related dioxygenase (phytanoyl-CoA dioxygenase family)
MSLNIDEHEDKDNAKRKPTRSFVDRTPLLEHPEQLRDQAEKEGYLFFRGLLPKERVLGLRRQLLEILQKRELLDSRYELMEGKADMDAMAKLELEGRTDVGVPDEVYLEIQKLEEFHAIAHDPAMLRVYALLFGEEPIPHPRNICRMVLPHTALTPTPPHQDFLHIQGTPSTWTCWFPIGDCPRELGGLAMLEGSHRYGVIGVTGHAGAGGLETILCDYNLEWATDDYFAGDVLIFHSYMVHKALPRQIPGYVRLSCDFRYQPASEVIDPSSLLPHGPYKWEELYEGWANKDIQYYWKTKDFTFSAWDESIRWQKEKIC